MRTTAFIFVVGMSTVGMGSARADNPREFLELKKGVHEALEELKGFNRLKEGSEEQAEAMGRYTSKLNALRSHMSPDFHALRSGQSNLDRLRGSVEQALGGTPGIGGAPLAPSGPTPGMVRLSAMRLSSGLVDTTLVKTRKAGEAKSVGGVGTDEMTRLEYRANHLTTALLNAKPREHEERPRVVNNITQVNNLTSVKQNLAVQRTTLRTQISNTRINNTRIQSVDKTKIAIRR